MEKAYGYIRVSDKSQVNGDGFARQKKAINDYAKKKNCKIVYIYQEEGISGTTDETQRPAFQDMISDILKNGIRTIIVERLDRLAREYRIQESLLIYLASKGIILINAGTGEDVTMAINSDPMKKALIQMQGVFSELEKSLLVKKLRVARDRKRKEKGKCEGRKSYKETNPELLKTIKRLRRKPRNGKRLSLKKTVIALNNQKVKSQTGKKITLNILSGIIYASMERKELMVPRATTLKRKA